MLIDKFGYITQKGWNKLEGICDRKKLFSTLEEFSLIERVVIASVLASNIRGIVTIMNAKEAMEAELESRGLKKEIPE